MHTTFQHSLNRGAYFFKDKYICIHTRNHAVASVLARDLGITNGKQVNQHCHKKGLYFKDWFPPGPVLKPQLIWQGDQRHFEGTKELGELNAERTIEGT